jgi:hypothetical protein
VFGVVRRLHRQFSLSDKNSTLAPLSLANNSFASSDAWQRSDKNQHEISGSDAKSMPKKHLQRLDSAIQQFKEALWTYNYVQEELRNAKATGHSVDGLLVRVKTAAADLTAAAQCIVDAEKPRADPRR